MKRFSIQLGDGFVGIIEARHRDKGESPRFSSHAIGDELHRRHFPKAFEMLTVDPFPSSGTVDYPQKFLSKNVLQFGLLCSSAQSS